MKSVGRLCEFVQRHSLQLADHNAACYIYRRISAPENSDMAPVPDVTGLLLSAVPVKANTAQCLVYKEDVGLDGLIKLHTNTDPDYITRSENNSVLHQFWCIREPGIQTLLDNRLDQIEGFYPLENWVSPQRSAMTGHDPDGSTAGNVAGLTFTLLVADARLEPLPCHRLLADLAGMDDYEFLQRLQKCFNIRVASGADDATPCSAREFGLYVAGHWYHLRLIDGTWFHADPVSDLDVSVVHDNMIAPMLNISDRLDARIAYTNAGSSVPALQQLVDSGQWQALWLMPAPTIAQLMHISDLGRYMPDNSVCFQPVFDATLFDPAILSRIGR